MACEIQKSRAKAFDAEQSAGGSVIVRAVRVGDSEAWQRMREELWPDETDGHARDIQKFFTQSPSDRGAVLVAERGGALVGFVELSLRQYAEGCETSPVAYLEGWYVSPDARRSGVGRALLRAAEEWGRSRGCSEFASDAGAENSSSAGAHRACGFDEVSLIRTFRKRL